VGAPPVFRRSLIVALDHENIVQGMREFTTVGSVQEAIVHSLLYSRPRLYDYKGFRSVLLDIVALYCNNINIQVDGRGILSRTHAGSGTDREEQKLGKRGTSQRIEKGVTSHLYICTHTYTYTYATHTDRGAET